MFIFRLPRRTESGPQFPWVSAARPVSLASMKKLLAALLFCLLPGSASFPRSVDSAVALGPVQIDPDHPGRRAIGRLHFLGGWQLTSHHPDFGGYSALRVEGDDFTALTDDGNYLRFHMERPGVADQVRFGTLPAFPSAAGVRNDRDSESMVIGPDENIWVGFETRNAILRYSRDFAAVQATAYPSAMRTWPLNSGAEAMARLSDGRFVVMAEGSYLAPQVNAALLFPGDPTDPAAVPISFGYRPPAGYAPTDAQQLPDGRLVVLNRHFSLLGGFRAAVTIIDPRGIAPGAVLAGELVAELRPPLTVDNMEGLSVVREGGRTILWMISDDNRFALERTLLLKFALDENGREASRPAWD